VLVATAKKDTETVARRPWTEESSNRRTSGEDGGEGDSRRKNFSHPRKNSRNGTRTRTRDQKGPKKGGGEWQNCSREGERVAWTPMWAIGGKKKNEGKTFRVRL